MTYVYWGVGIYLAIGVLFGVMLLQTPYSENGAIVNGLLWPIYLLAFLTGRA